MDRTERFYKIDRLLRATRVVAFAHLRQQLEVSSATLKRDLEYMRSRLNAPIVFDRAAGGYRLAEDAGSQERYELPGLWFSPAEVHALLTLKHLVSNLRAGSVLGPHVEAVSTRLQSALGTGDRSGTELARRVHILDMASRDLRIEHFETVGSALLRRRRLRLAYFGRERGDTTERIVSPQRLVHYRDNWYLDAYCHLREGLRSFAVDAIQAAAILDDPALDVDEDVLDAALGSGYGIFAGEAVQWATLRFTPERARWIAAEQWHPQQRTRYEPDGSYVLELAYSDPRELVMDVLRHGAEVEVLAPAALRRLVIATLDATRKRYADADAADPGA